MKRSALALVVVILISVALISCGGYGSSSSPSSGGKTTKLKFRALVSQDVSNALGAGLIIIDAQKDLRAFAAPVGTQGFLPTMMVVSNDRKLTVAVGSTGTSLQVVNNLTEAATGTVNLPQPGTTESVVISVDNATVYAAVPNAAVPGGASAGAIAIINLNLGGLPAMLPVPNVHYLAQSGDGSKILAFSDNSDAVTVVSPFNIVAGQKDATCPTSVCTSVGGFDRPVFGFFSSDNTQAWILNCGPECGGAQASVQLLDLVHNTAGTPTPIPGGVTAGFIKNQTLYVAGNPPAGSNSCSGGPSTAATTCGRLTVVDLSSLPQAGGIQPTAVIPDGYHTHIDISGDGQLFAGSRGCTNIVPVNPGDEQRGCLAILNTNNGNLIIPPDNGDVTGLQPITNRTVFYVVEGGELRIYDTTTDKLYLLESIDIFGNAVDVKLIDF
ncbi:MAG: hypothetical protein WA628_08980 [Terriglobales bacterium]